MKILFYCQHVLGIGHFFRSFEIAKSLAPHQVLFVEGGQPLIDIPFPSHIRRLLLPPLMMNETFEKFNVEGEELLRVQKSRRDELLKAYRDFLPDVIIIELFPFGRKKFSFELIPLLEKTERDSKKVIVVCSLRDILVEKADKDRHELWVLQNLNRFFDLLLIHADERITRLEESFSRVDQILIPIYYTGFVARKPAKAKIEKCDGRTHRKIVVSTGGGKVGSELIEAAILALRKIRSTSLEMEIYIGPFMESSTKDHLLSIARDDERIRFRPFALDFLEVLLKADISISMAGYNTMMDLLSTGTYGILYPFKQNREQSLRAERLAKFGNFVVINDATPEVVAQEIETALKVVSSPIGQLKHSLNLRGAEETRKLLEEILVQRNFSIH